MNKTSIEWTHRPETGGEAGGFTWNPIRARVKPEHISNPAYRPIHSGTFCTRISPGCTNCYASTINKRFGNGLEYTVPNLERVEFFIDEKILEEPLRRKKPATIFVGDMFDLFHEAIPQEMVAEVLRVAWKLPRHTFQFLTKRTERMCRLVNAAQEHWGVEFGEWMWFGASVESQPYADKRIPELLRTRCALHFLSVEPLLEAVDLSHLPANNAKHLDALRGIYVQENWQQNTCTSALISWVICGGESGPGARPFNLAWAESLLEQCRDAGVPFFMKQLGSKPVANCKDPSLPPVDLRVFAKGRENDRKGGDPTEWPELLRVREFPTSQKAEAVPA